VAINANNFVIILKSQSKIKTDTKKINVKSLAKEKNNVAINAKLSAMNARLNVLIASKR
jgi:hypothetical protein